VATTDARWAVVTGASAGIGAEFARQLAAQGWSLVLVARRADRLEALGRELESKHGVATRRVALDLAAPDAGPTLFAATEGLFVELLVNNAGYGVPGALTSQPWPVHRDFLQVLVSLPCELSYLYVPAMQRANRGAIINVASLAGHMPGSAGHTMYAASKAYLIKFSQSLALENERHGVKVQALCPGFTYSEFHDVTGARQLVSKMPGYMWMNADAVVRESLAALERGGPVVLVTGRFNRFFKWLGKHLPDGLALAMMRRQSRKFRNAD
jgi:uncharacterized protein